MTGAEAAKLLTLASAFDNRSLDDMTVGAWLKALDGLPYEDCVAAVYAHFRDSTDWLMPAVVRRHAVAISKARAAADAAAKRRELEQPVAPPVAPEVALQNVAKVREMLAHVGRRVDGPAVNAPRESPETAEALTRPCPWCGAAPGQPCHVPETHKPRARPHPARLEEAVAA